MGRFALVTVRSAKYLVPVRYVNRKVRVSLRATEVMILDGRTLIAIHPRTPARGGQCVQVDHYLQVLQIKPGALPGSRPRHKHENPGSLLPLMKLSGPLREEPMGDTTATKRAYRSPTAPPLHGSLRCHPAGLLPRLLSVG
ncbi:hypothetical protein ACFUCV_13895 [Specibacter sp. NPDC057265]|uniref:Mu transposase domain-containing protein n=1 Tax=Specibacter sp. NPDC057265 TaxID=3346075 RepID=UPI0036283396